MYSFGIGLLIIGALITFGADSLYKKGKVKTMKNLLKIKGLGLGLTIIGVLLMIKYN